MEAIPAQAASRAFRVLFEHAPVGVCTIKLDGHVFAANGALAMLLRMSQSAVQRRTITDLTYPADLQRTSELFRELASGTRDAYSIEKRYVRSDGTATNVRATVMLVAADGEPEFAVALVEPLGDVARLQNKIGAARAAVHDFNNLLLVMVGNAEILLAQLAHGAADPSYAQRIKDAASRSVPIVRGLLDDEPEQPSERLDVNSVILELGDIVRHLLGSRVELVLRLDPSEPAVVANREGLERAIANIATNARDAMPDGGTFTIETRREDARTVISLSDTGVGIDASTKARIFERDFTTKGHGVGHGIGLANVRDFVESAGGSVDVETTVGHGSTFALRFPS